MIIPSTKAYIENIEHQNARLKEIVWMQSHVVRAPLSRLVRLVRGMESLEKDFGKENFRKMIMDSAVELDDIIRNIVNKTEEVNLHTTNKK